MNISSFEDISWKQIVDNSINLEQVTITVSAENLKRISLSYEHLMNRIENNVQVYGVTTGFGDGAKKTLNKNNHDNLQTNLLNYLDCGVGELTPPHFARATLLCRIISFAQGYSGVSPELIEMLIEIFNNGYAPEISMEGSLGASGDLIPLSGIGQALLGNGNVFNKKNFPVHASAMLEKLNLKPYEFKYKDALGLVNGTSLMTAISCHALKSFEDLIENCYFSMSAIFIALNVHPSAFGPLVNSIAKRHSGQKEVAQKISELCEWSKFDFAPSREQGIHEQSLQEPYSIRCTPQIMGPCIDVFQSVQKMVDLEINSCNDNPIINPENGEISSGGNFYGGSIALAMEQLSWACSHIADLLDRQILLTVHANYNRGLPADLVNKGDEFLDHHGLKGLHQYASSLTSEIVRMAVPSSIFSRSSESHNQDKISLGTHSARNVTKQLELVIRLSAIHSIIAAQALDLRGSEIPRPIQEWYCEIRKNSSFVHQDRPLKNDIMSVYNFITSPL